MGTVMPMQSHNSPRITNNIFTAKAGYKWRACHTSMTINVRVCVCDLEKAEATGSRDFRKGQGQDGAHLRILPAVTEQSRCVACGAGPRHLGCHAGLAPASDQRGVQQNMAQVKKYIILLTLAAGRRTPAIVT